MSSFQPDSSPIRYGDLRPEIRTGDLLLCSGTGWFSKMIQAATNSPWSHVALIVRLEAIDRVMLLESLESVGVRAVPLSKYLYDYDAEGHPYPGRLCVARHSGFAAHSKALIQFGQFAVDRLGYAYDNQMIAKIAARITLSKWLDAPARDDAFEEWKNAGLERDREYICSEYVYECYRQLGVTIEHDPRGFVTPADFVNDPQIEMLAKLSVE